MIHLTREGCSQVTDHHYPQHDCGRKTWRILLHTPSTKLPIFWAPSSVKKAIRDGIDGFLDDGSTVIRNRASKVEQKDIISITEEYVSLISETKRKPISTKLCVKVR